MGYTVKIAREDATTVKTTVIGTGSTVKPSPLACGVASGSGLFSAVRSVQCDSLLPDAGGVRVVAPMPELDVASFVGEHISLSAVAGAAGWNTTLQYADVT
eukprot:6205343-Pleurochrysis_carterae.AAC.3